MSAALDAIAARYGLPPGAAEEWTYGPIAGLDRAIVFVMAYWSGPSAGALGLLAKVLSDIEPRPRLLVCDIDEIPASDVSIFGRLGGWGETFWVREGRIVASESYRKPGAAERVRLSCELLR